MKKLTLAAVTEFAQTNAGKQFFTLKQKRPFVVDVRNGTVIFYPESGTPFFPELDGYIPHYNQTQSLRPTDYPKKFWSNSYFVALVAAMINPKSISFAATETAVPTYEPLPPSPALEAKVRLLRKKGLGIKPTGQAKPKSKEITSTVILRDPAVKAWVLEAAAGKCDCCNMPAPFKDAFGDSFFEVHHVKSLGDGGSDRISNAVALCPNCHRACHHAINRAAITKSLYNKYSRLIPE